MKTEERELDIRVAIRFFGWRWYRHLPTNLRVFVGGKNTFNKDKFEEIPAGEEDKYEPYADWTHGIVPLPFYSRRVYDASEIIAYAFARGFTLYSNQTPLSATVIFQKDGQARKGIGAAGNAETESPEHMLALAIVRAALDIAPQLTGEEVPFETNEPEEPGL